MAKADNGQKLFGTEFNGFNKKQVTEYISSLEQKYRDAIAKIEDDVNALETSYNELQDKYAELFDSYMALQEEKAKIADVLIGAENRAGEIIEQAKAEGEKERSALELQAESLRETIVDKNKILKDMKAAANSMAAEFEVAVREKLEEILLMVNKNIDVLNDRTDAIVSDAAMKNGEEENETPEAETESETESDDEPQIAEDITESIESADESADDSSEDDLISAEIIIDDDSEDNTLSAGDLSAIDDEIASIFVDEDKNDGDFL